MREYKVAGAAADDPDQGRLPGFDHLQRAYLVARNGEPAVVPIAHLTDGEIRGKAAELRGMADGCIAHAAELERYADERDIPAAAAE